MNKNEIFILHYGKTFIEASSSEEALKQIVEEKKKEYPAINWQISSINDFAEICYEEGHDDGFEEGQEYCEDIHSDAG